tara:strand:+ start:380 stop:517 length:138 start_codon:yes stop_codon:yes gene_type:complete
VTKNYQWESRKMNNIEQALLNASLDENEMMENNFNVEEVAKPLSP